MLSHYQMVKEFHENFNLPIRSNPQIPPEKEVILRTDLDEEEYDELCEANENDDLVEMSDALTDLLYVTYGQGLVYGIDLDREYVHVDMKPTLLDKELRDTYLRDIETALSCLIDSHSTGIDSVKYSLNKLLDATYEAGKVFGINLDETFKEVHRSNMSKLGEDGKPIYRADGKVLKGPNFFKPNLKSVMGL
jgi:predicted HAD superfamily Cof-like phosphohydrolase